MESSTNAKDAEKLLMSFDTMNFTIPSPTSASSRKRASLFVVEKEAETVQGDTLTRCTSTAVDTKAAAIASCSQTATSTPVISEEHQMQQVQGSCASSCTSSLLVGSSMDPVLSVLNIETTVPSSSASGKKIGAYSPAARKLRLQKFHEKRKNRTWKKSIKYDCRKKLADDRPRIKGRFVRVGLETSNDAKADAVPSLLTASASIEYPFSTSVVDAMASPAMPPAHPVKSHVTPSCLSSLASAAKQASASVAKSASVAAPVTSAATAAAAALPFARMIASV